MTATHIDMGKNLEALFPMDCLTISEADKILLKSVERLRREVDDYLMGAFAVPTYLLTPDRSPSCPTTST